VGPPGTEAPLVEFLLQLARQRGASCTPTPLPRLAQSSWLVAFALGRWPVFVPELLYHERRVGGSELPNERLFVVDALVQGASKAFSETSCPSAYLERSAVHSEGRVQLVLPAVDFVLAFSWWG
jgi:hypothetical protein